MQPTDTLADHASAPERPFASSAERNRDPIYQVIRRYLPTRARILELASGTGQHAVYCAAKQPGWQWQCSDLPERLDGIAQWLVDQPYLPAPMMLDAGAENWSATLGERYDAVLTINSLHIMPWEAAQNGLRQSAQVLDADGHLLVYGPFHYGGQATTPSNADFDASLQARDARMGLRDVEAVEAVATYAGLQLLADHAMPANNRLLVFRRR